MKRLAGARSICLDAYGTDSAGKKFDLEVQRQDKGADPHRARYHSSVMDIENLHSVKNLKNYQTHIQSLSLKKIFMVRVKLFTRLRESTLQRVNLLKMGSISFM